MRIAPDLAKTLGRVRALVLNIKTNIKTLDDIETKILAHLWGSSNLPRGNPLRADFSRPQSARAALADDDDYLHISRDQAAAVRRAESLAVSSLSSAPSGCRKSGKCRRVSSISTRTSSKGIRNALSTATPDELEGARWACFLSRFLTAPAIQRHDAIVVRGTPMPWRSVEVANLMWPWLSVRAAVVGFIIFAMRNCNSEVREDAAAAVASVSSQTSILLPKPS